MAANHQHPLVTGDGAHSTGVDPLNTGHVAAGKFGSLFKQLTHPAAPEGKTTSRQRKDFAEKQGSQAAQQLQFDRWLRTSSKTPEQLKAERLAQEKLATDAEGGDVEEEDFTAHNQIVQGVFDATRAPSAQPIKDAVRAANSAIDNNDIDFPDDNDKDGVKNDVKKLAEHIRLANAGTPKEPDKSRFLSPHTVDLARIANATAGKKTKLGKGSGQKFDAKGNIIPGGKGKNNWGKWDAEHPKR